ncbi:MAG: DUF4349 domain-containing protein [Firmicutes bacterium]|nr:DUF4349 domain-containing protein [Bacillota bacterium]
MNCEKFIALLPSYPDAIPGEKGDFRLHAAECPRCAARLEEHEALLGALASLDEKVAVPPSFGERWRAAIQMEPIKPGGSRLLRWQTWAVAAAAVCMVVCAVSLLSGGMKIPVAGDMDKQRAYMSLEADAPLEKSEPLAPPAPRAERALGGGLALSRRPMDMETTQTFAEAETKAEVEQSPIILHSASVTLLTSQYDADVKRVDDLLSAMGGWSEYRSVWGEPEDGDQAGGRYATMRLRVPLQSLAFFMEAVAAIGKVTASEMVAEDVSDQYYDTRGRLSMYEAQRARMTELLGQAETMSDVVEIESRLGEIQYTIETLVGRLNHWNARKDNAVVHLYVREVAEIQMGDAPLGQRLGNAFRQSLRAAWGFMNNAAVFLVIASPYILCAAAAAGIAFFIVRTRRKRK